ncbi:MAG TPA: nuclear transport factor 2 family protein [Caulobacteraceae bacterium]|nr:nuclear transport factor 2 family protein [Caulobacteraceae bacterium]
MARTIGDAFGGQVTTLEEQRAIWAEALHEDAIWEGPMFERPVQVIGREATGRFMELLLSVVPRFSTTLVGAYPTSDPNTVIIESHGGGETVEGGRYTQRYFSLITTRDGQAFRMREYCNPFQTYKAFGKARWEAATGEIMARYNRPWPASQAPDPITLPPI